VVNASLPKVLQQSGVDLSVENTYFVPYWTVDDTLATTAKEAGYGVHQDHLVRNDGTVVNFDRFFDKDYNLRTKPLALSSDDVGVTPMADPSTGKTDAILRQRMAIVVAESPVQAARMVNSAIREQLAEQGSRYAGGLRKDGFLTAGDPVNDVRVEAGQYMKIGRHAAPRVGAADVFSVNGLQAVLAGAEYDPHEAIVISAQTDYGASVDRHVPEKPESMLRLSKEDEAALRDMLGLPPAPPAEKADAQQAIGHQALPAELVSDGYETEDALNTEAVAANPWARSIGKKTETAETVVDRAPPAIRAETRFQMRF